MEAVLPVFALAQSPNAPQEKRPLMCSASKEGPSKDWPPKSRRRSKESASPALLSVKACFPFPSSSPGEVSFCSKSD